MLETTGKTSVINKIEHKGIPVTRLKTIRCENTMIRFVSMWIVGLAILLFTWTFSFKALPEYIVRGGSGTFHVPVRAENEALTFARIFLWNLCIGCIPIAIGNLVRLKGVPLGYILAFYHWGMYGILLGTNSFVIPGPGKFLPSLVTLFYGSGIYEISSYTLICSATFNLHALYEKLGERSESYGERKRHAPGVSKIESVLIALAILILAVSNYYEATHIFHA
jgi:hypothetical protein